MQDVIIKSIKQLNEVLTKDKKLVFESTPKKIEVEEIDNLGQ